MVVFVPVWGSPELCLDVQRRVFVDSLPYSAPSSTLTELLSLKPSFPVDSCCFLAIC